MSSASCRAADVDLIESACAGASVAPIAADAAGTPLRLAVYMTYRSVDAFLTLGAPSCSAGRPATNCYSSAASAVVGHIDIFEAFDFNVNVGSQTLRCPAYAPCGSNNTATVVYSLPALGVSVATALLATATTGSFGIPVVLTGVMSSDSYLLSGTRPSVAPSLASVFTAAVTNNSAALSLSTSQSHVTGASGQFQLVWRGAPLAARLAIRTFAAEDVCGVEPNFPRSAVILVPSITQNLMCFTPQLTRRNGS